MSACLLILCLQTTWYVDASAPAPGQGTQSMPFSRVDVALAEPAVVTGDVIEVAPGTYVDEAVDFLGKDVVVQSSGGALVTTIQGRVGDPQPRSAVRFVNGEGPGAVLDGFTIEVGDGEPFVDPWLGQITAGGGIFCDGASPQLRNLVVTGGPSTAQVGGGCLFRNSSALVSDVSIESVWSQAFFGGGVFASNSSILFRRATIRGCQAFNEGAGVYFSGGSVQFVECTIRGNFCPFGGAAGIYFGGLNFVMEDSSVILNGAIGRGGGLLLSGSNVVLRNSVIAYNSTGFDAYEGGGLYMAAGSMVTEGCRFEGNDARNGGAVYVANGTAHFDTTHFIRNRADAPYNSSSGGAIHANGSVTVSRSVFLENRAASDQFASGGHIWGSVAVDGCTFVGGTAAAGQPTVIASGNGSSVANSIVVGSAAPKFEGTAVVFSNVEGGWPGFGNIDEDPRFWGLAEEDFGLLPDSPCIDSGDPALGPDPDGTPRDMGAIAFDPRRCEAACDGPLGSLICVATSNSTGGPARLSALGSTDVTRDRLVFAVDGVPTGQFGFFLGAQQPGFSLLGGGSQGILCLGAPVLRFDSFVLTDRGTGTVSFRPRLGAFPQATSVLPGDTWYFQYWFRDATTVQTSNTSSAVAVTFE